jgi:hypothetical protein
VFYQLIAGHQYVELAVVFAWAGTTVHHLVIKIREFNQLIAGHQLEELDVGFAGAGTTVHHLVISS